MKTSVLMGKSSNGSIMFWPVLRLYEILYIGRFESLGDQRMVILNGMLMRRGG